MVLLRATMFLRRAARSVGDAIELHPFKMNSVIGAIVYGAGEGMAQLSAPKDERTTERLPAITMLGVVQVGALMTIWYNTLERMCGTSSSTRTVLHKICFDQVLWSSQNDGMFLAVCGILEKPDLPSALHETKRGFLTTWINDCAVWPLTNFLGFAVVPTKFLPAYMAFNQFLWQVFLSFITLPVGGAEEAPPPPRRQRPRVRSHLHLDEPRCNPTVEMQSPTAVSLCSPPRPVRLHVKTRCARSTWS